MIVCACTAGITIFTNPFEDMEKAEAAAEEAERKVRAGSVCD